MFFSPYLATTAGGRPHWSKRSRTSSGSILATCLQQQQKKKPKTKRETESPFQSSQNDSNGFGLSGRKSDTSESKSTTDSAPGGRRRRLLRLLRLLDGVVVFGRRLLAEHGRRLGARPTGRGPRRRPSWKRNFQITNNEPSRSRRTTNRELRGSFQVFLFDREIQRCTGFDYSRRSAGRRGARPLQVDGSGGFR